jgi:hypothetical protein
MLIALLWAEQVLPGFTGATLLRVTGILVSGVDDGACSLPPVRLL